MDHLHHRVSPSQSIKPSAIPKDVDENEPNYQQTNPNLQNLKKQTTKNYMSTTISAASKAIGPKKKILAERNEGSEMSSFEANFKEISVLDNPDESLFQWIGDVEDGHVDDLSSRPYDPLTNYLSPRPQFLRYKPNRRRCHVIFRGRENGDGEIEDGLISRSGSFDSLKASNEDATSDTNGSSVISSSCSSISGERSLEQEEIADEVEGTNLETEEGDEGEIEDEEEDRGCNFKGLFKSLFLLGFLVLSTMFISSMNSSSPLCELRFGEGIEDGYCKMQNHTFSHDGEEIQKGLMEVKKRTFEIDIEERNVVDFMYRGEETQMNSIDVNEDIGGENFEERERTDELKEETFFESGETDAVEVAEGENKAKVEDFGSVVEPQIGDIEEASIWGLNEPVEDYQTPFFSEEQSGIVVNPVEEVHNEEASNEDVIGSINEEVGNSEDAAEEVVTSERMITDTEVHNKPLEDEILSQVFVGVMIFSTITASLLLWFRLRAKPCSEPLIEQMNISQPLKPCSESSIEEKCVSVHPSGGDAHIDEVYSFGKNSLSSIHSAEKAHEYSQSRAPTVEFLGEFVVREISFGSKNRTLEVEESSDYSVSSEKKILDGKSHSVSIQAQPAHSEFSVMDSHSQGRGYSAKKHDGGDGEANVVMTTPTPARRSSRKGEVKVATTTTPVRRSSRIRNQAILSP